MELILSFLIYVLITWLIAHFITNWIADLLPTRFANGASLISYGIAGLVVWALHGTLNSVIISPLTSLFTHGK